MDIVTRKEAKALGLVRYFSGKPCKHGHVAERVTSGGTCCECQRTPEAKQRDRERVRARDSEASSQRYRTWRLENPEKAREKLRSWRERNPEHAKQTNKRSNTKRRKERPFIDTANNAKRRASKKKATPTWLTSEDLRNIKAVYEMAVRLSTCLKIPYEVDHVIPLKGDSVCGLHVPWNLAPIPASLNRRKKNKLHTIGVVH